jgi:L-ascorbate metabolism protein UlaG (beta-lactamase superfamily)
MKGKTSVTYLGHATTLIEMDGVRLMTDPLLTAYVGPLKRQYPLPNPNMLDVDIVLITHLHGDHLNLPSLKKLGQDIQLLVPKGAGHYLKSRHFNNVEELEKGEYFDIGKIRVSPTPAIHEGRHLPWTPIVDPIGYLIEGTNEIYFAGDTDIFPEMSAIGKTLDLAFLPVWGWGPNLGKGHLDPHRAAEALLLLKPRIAIPIHWGTYSPIGFGLFRPWFLSQPPLEFAKNAALIAPNVIVQVLQPGQSFDLSFNQATGTSRQ